MVRGIDRLLFTICLLVSLGSMTEIHAQRSRDTSTAEVLGIVDLHNDQFSSVRISIRSETSVYNQLESFQASVKYGELVLDYVLKDPSFKKEQLDHSYFVSIELYRGNVPVFVRPDRIFGDIDTLVGGERNRQVVVTGLMEDQVALTDTVRIVLSVEHSFDLNESILCSEGEPKWRMQQKLPFIMGAVGGAGLIAIGAVLEADAQNTYDEYLVETDKATGEDLYADANTQHKWAQGLMIGGGVIIAADVVWYFMRRKRYQRQKYLYDTYCGGATMKLEPHFETGNLALGRSTNIGLTFKYTIK